MSIMPAALLQLSVPSQRLAFWRYLVYALKKAEAISRPLQNYDEQYNSHFTFN